MSKLPLILFSALALLAHPGRAAEWTVDALMQQLAQKSVERASFVEKKTLALLDKPVESSGELLYRAPGLLEKRTLKPKPELLRIDGEQLTIERGKKTQRVNLADYPEVGGFVDSIRGTLAGDRKALERSYRLDLGGTPERWTLQLTPNDPKMSGLIEKILIGGRRGDVRTIEIVQADGDRSLMTVERLPE